MQQPLLWSERPSRTRLQVIALCNVNGHSYSINSTNGLKRLFKVFFTRKKNLSEFILYLCTIGYEIGSLKWKTFFLNQLSAVSNVNYPLKGDFLISHKYLFEVGGKGKSFDQIKDVPDSFLAIDDVETGNGNRIPLWMFGLLY